MSGGGTEADLEKFQLLLACVMDVASIFCSMDVSLDTRCSLDWSEVEWMATGAPKNRNVVSPR